MRNSSIKGEGREGYERYCCARHEDSLPLINCIMYWNDEVVRVFSLSSVFSVLWRRSILQIQ